MDVANFFNPISWYGVKHTFKDAMSLLLFIDSKLDGDRWEITPPDVQQARDAVTRFTKKAVHTPEFDYDWLYKVSDAIHQCGGIASCIEDEIAASKMLNSMAAIREALIEWMRKTSAAESESFQPVRPEVEGVPTKDEVRPRDAKYLASIADVSVKTVTDIARDLRFPRRRGRPKSATKPFEYCTIHAIAILQKTMKMPTIRRNPKRSVIIEKEISRLYSEIIKDL